MYNLGGVMIHCGGMIKSLSGEEVSQGFTAGSFIPHRETPNPQRWLCSAMQNVHQMHSPFKLASFLVLVCTILETDNLNTTWVCSTSHIIMNIQPIFQKTVP